MANTTSHSSSLSFPFLLAYFLLLTSIQLVFASADTHQFPRPVYNQWRRFVDHSNLTTNSSTGDDAFAMVARAQLALGPANKKRIENLQLNHYAFENATVVAAQVPAPPLNYNNTANLNGTTSQRRSVFQNTSDSNSSNGSFYRLPAELIEAARIVAESRRTIPDSSKQAALYAEVLAQYGSKKNDTNRMPQAIRHADGLFEHPSNDYEKVLYANNLTEPTLETRGVSTFWMANIVQNGASPFAPAGYKGSIVYVNNP